MRTSSVLLLVALGGASCSSRYFRPIPLGADPTVNEPKVSDQALYSVAWWRKLVPDKLLEYEPVETASPAVDPDTERVVVSTRDGTIHCLAPDGRVEWTLSTRGRPYAGATVVDGVAYVPGGDSVLYAMRVLTGEQVWSYSPGEEIVTEPTVADGTVLIATQSEALYAVSLETGKWLWQYRRDPPSGFSIRGVARPLVRDGVVYAGFGDGMLVALTLEAGAVVWERRLTTTGGTQFLDVDTQPVIDDGGRLFAASFKDGLYAIDASTGDLLWSSSKPGVTGLFLYRGTLYTAGDAAVSAIDPDKGTELWSRGLSDFTSKGKLNNSGHSLTMARGRLVVPTSTALAFVDPRSGKVDAMWDPGRGVTAVPAGHASVRTGSRLYVLSNLGTLFALELLRGSVP